jgi:hypothetical protein
MTEKFFNMMPNYNQKAKVTQVAPDLLHSQVVEIPKDLESDLDGGLDSLTNVWCFKPDIHNKFMRYLKRTFPDKIIQEDCIYHFAKNYTPIDSYLIGESNCILLVCENLNYKLFIFGYDLLFLKYIKKSIEIFLKFDCTDVKESCGYINIPGSSINMEIYEEF